MVYHVFHSGKLRKFLEIDIPSGVKTWPANGERWEDAKLVPQEGHVKKLMRRPSNSSGLEFTLW